MEPDFRLPPDMTESDESSGSSVSEEDASWITWFCSIRGNEFFCEVDEEYIQDEFNLTGLSSEVPFYEYALDTILDAESPNAEMLTEDQQETVDAAAELLYGLIHARYILSAKGLAAMYDKYKGAEFGACNRVLCDNQAYLPCGQSDSIRKHMVSLFCPRCCDIYQPRSTRHLSIDGAYFGTTFPHLFTMTYPQVLPNVPRQAYVPRVFGFRLHRPGISDVQPRQSKSGRAAAGAADAAAAGSAPQQQPRAEQGAGATAAAQPGGRRELTTVLPTDRSGHIIGRDGRLLNPDDDFFDEEDAPTAGRPIDGPLMEEDPGTSPATPGGAGAGAQGARGGAAGRQYAPSSASVEKLDDAMEAAAYGGQGQAGQWQQTNAVGRRPDDGITAVTAGMSNMRVSYSGRG